MASIQEKRKNGKIVSFKFSRIVSKKKQESIEILASFIWFSITFFEYYNFDNIRLKKYDIIKTNYLISKYSCYMFFVIYKIE